MWKEKEKEEEEENRRVKGKELKERIGQGKRKKGEDRTGKGI